MRLKKEDCNISINISEVITKQIVLLHLQAHFLSKGLKNVILNTFGLQQSGENIVVLHLPQQSHVVTVLDITGVGRTEVIVQFLELE